jgi:hypothetical protein
MLQAQGVNLRNTLYTPCAAHIHGLRLQNFASVDAKVILMCYSKVSRFLDVSL